MEYIHRFLEERIRHTFKRGKSVLLLGARQTGKTTLINRFKHDLLISFVPPDIRQQYEKSPHLLRGEVEALAAAQTGKRPLVILDEVQKVRLSWMLFRILSTGGKLILYLRAQAPGNFAGGPGKSPSRTRCRL